MKLLQQTSMRLLQVFDELWCINCVLGAIKHAVPPQQTGRDTNSGRDGPVQNALANCEDEDDSELNLFVVTLMVSL